MEKTKKIVLLGDSAFAEVAYECFTHDSEYEVVGFAVEEAYFKKHELFGLPIVPLEKIEDYFSPQETEFYAALVYTQLNRLRTRFYQIAKEKGYRPASYISSRAFVWPNAMVGEHCFIFENNTIQPFVKIGNNVVLWSGNHIGHHGFIEDHCFIASQVVISGSCHVGKYTFIGVNAAIANDKIIGEDNWIGPGVTIAKNTKANSIFTIDQAKASPVSAQKFFKLLEN